MHSEQFTNGIRSTQESANCANAKMSTKSDPGFESESLPYHSEHVIDSLRC